MFAFFKISADLTAERHLKHELKVDVCTITYTFLLLANKV